MSRRGGADCASGHRLCRTAHLHPVADMDPCCPSTLPSSPHIVLSCPPPPLPGLTPCGSCLTDKSPLPASSLPISTHQWYLLFQLPQSNVTIKRLTAYLAHCRRRQDERSCTTFFNISGFVEQPFVFGRDGFLNELRAVS